MPYDAKAIANYFIGRAKESGEALTQMKLHKLIYFAHGWHLALTGEPLIDESLQAWNYGPVVPSVYTEFKRFGSEPITDLATSYTPDPSGSYRFVPYAVPTDEATLKLLNQVYDLYGKLPAGRLSAMTHEQGSPWSEVTKDGTSMDWFMKIDNTLIRKSFDQKKQQKTL